MAVKSILIVEDHALIRSSLREFFEGEGYPVLLAGDGGEALALFSRPSPPKPGLMLVDFRMPGMNGPDFLLEFERLHPAIFATIPVFMMSAGTEFKRLPIKVSGFLPKPFDLDELHRIAAQYCH